MTIGLIAAMDKEIKKYQELFTLKSLDSKFPIYEGNCQNHRILLCVSGIGKVNAAIITEYLIEHYQIDIIINSGCCGSLTEQGKILDTILASFVTYHDFNPLRIMESCVPNKGRITTDKTLMELAQRILKEQNISYLVGGITSGDCFVTSSKMRDEIFSKTNCIGVDMESTSIGHACSLNKVPFLIIRTISDFADGIEEQEEKAASISALLVKELINNLSN